MTSDNNFFKKIFFKGGPAVLAVLFALFFSSGAHAALKTKEEVREILGIKEWKSVYGPLRKKHLKGAVVLLHFSSFNDLRGLYKADTLINWQGKYELYGLRIIHMLTPDFSFEKAIEIPQYLSQKKVVNYPIALDYKKTQWQAYGSPEKPFDILIDPRGRVRNKIPSTESYEAEEKMIQTLLKEKDPSFEMELETYSIPKVPTVKNFPLGYKKNMRLGNSERTLSEVRQKFKLPSGELNQDVVYLTGYWKLGEEAVETAQSGAEIHFNWDGGPLFILGGIDRDSPTPVEAVINGPSPFTEKLKGVDLVRQGDGFYVLLQQTKLYTLTKRQPEGKYSLILRFPEAGVKIYQISYPEKQK